MSLLPTSSNEFNASINTPHQIQQVPLTTTNTVMAATKLNIKLLVDKKSNKVLFAEAGKEFVDFLFSLLSLPVGSIIRVLNKNKMVGCLGNLYGSVEDLSDTYVLSNKSKDSLLKPQLANSATNVPLLLPNDAPTAVKYYTCGSGSYHRYITDNPLAMCPSCHYKMSTQVSYVAPVVAGSSASATEGTGYVKGVVTYMIMDDFSVIPMSTISSIALLQKFNVGNVNFLTEKLVDVGMDEALELLRASLQSKTVLSDVFLGKKVE
ncbi:hypothetical protein GIB67_006352 [Kingdonia uniflora]|uniref:DUF674 domain-containing protein n=1 Tax=Kingdonia uniflora TaxID=39325 RepID=A0A7J7P0K9_9MAGN|nr:hypothetical protein GIB67_006352 [Kingdonia uniflora]